MDAGRPVLLGPTVGEVRRRVGPTAWCALEVLAASAVARHGENGASVEASIRGVAVELGISKNAAHRALLALRRCGLIVAEQHRGRGGRFDVGVYTVMVSPAILEPLPAGTQRHRVAPTRESVDLSRGPVPSRRTRVSGRAARAAPVGVGPNVRSLRSLSSSSKSEQTGARERARVVPGSMLSVETLHASSAAVTAAYYAKYLTAAPGEVPGVWSGRQAAGLGLSGTVDVEALELLLSGRDPVSGTRLGGELVDRYRANGKAIQAVSGFDATFSAPKSVSVWWALTGDDRLLRGARRGGGGGAGASGAVRVDDAHPIERRPPPSRHARVDDGDVSSDDVAGR